MWAPSLDVAAGCVCGHVGPLPGLCNHLWLGGIVGLNPLQGGDIS